MLWVCRFEMGKHWEAKGVKKPFFPEVEIRFMTEGFAEDGGEGKHWHVPLLAGPFSYTTYRGS